MSAITGILYRDGRKVDLELIEKMNNRLSHRGPDGSAVWCEGSVALGHQMLWTTPESLHEKLPFEDENSGLVITADARIDNRDELSKELDIEDKEEVSDSYFILKAYEKWGKDCPDKLLGDFAFAIWDKNEEKLFCARDHMGVKPFYYHLNDKGFFFATEIKAILSLLGVMPNLNKLRVADYLVNLYEDKEITFYENIFRLPAAHYLIISSNNKLFGQYWELDPTKEIKMDSDEDYAHVFLDIFTKAVECRLRTAFPLGSLLSGGLDSSSIACTAKKILAEKGNYSLKTFSATFDETPECDEQYYIKKVLDFTDLEPHYIHADQINPLFQIDKVLWHLDEPSFAPNLYIHWTLHQKAMNNGVRVILDGLDGDTTVSHGIKFEIDYFKSFQWKKCINELYIKSRRNKTSFFKLLLKSFIPFIPEFIIRIINLLNIVPAGTKEKLDLLNENFAVETGIEKKLNFFYKRSRLASRSSKSYHYSSLNSGIMQYFLETVDKNAAASCLETRYPFFDRRLIEFCLALPIEQKISNGCDRVIMRRAMENILPKEIQWREGKTGLGLNFRKNLLFFEKDTFDDILNQDNLIWKYVKKNSLLKIYNEDIIHTAGNAFLIFRVINLAIWLDKY